MSNNSWDKDLRARMEDYSEQPPEGLWEAVEGAVGAAGAGEGESVAAGTKAGTATGTAAKAGSRSRIRRFIPAFVALAGGIAAALIFMPVLHRPASVPSTSEFGVVASADHIDTPFENDTVVSDKIAETTDIIVNNSDVIVSGSGGSLKKALPLRGPLPVSRGRRLFQTTPTAGDEAGQIAENAPAELSQTREIIPTTVEETIPTAGDKDENSDSGNKAEDNKVKILFGEEFVTVEPADLMKLRRRREITGRFAMAGNPGGVNRSTSGYGMTRFGAPAAAGASPMAMVGRNKASTTDISHNQTARVGFLVNLPLSEHWSLESGLEYTQLKTSVTTTSGSIISKENQSLSYFGIPFYTRYDFFPGRKYGLYASVGPRLELSNDYASTRDAYSGTTLVSSDELDVEMTSHRIWSVSIAAGAEMSLFGPMAVFVQPSLDWRFLIPEEAPESFYTARRLSPSILFGIRFSLD